MHGREQEAEEAVAEIERATEASGGHLEDVDESKAIEVNPASNIGFVALASTLFATYPKRAVLGAALMITQSFLYNAIFFTYALVLTKIYGVRTGDTRLLLHVLRAREPRRAAHHRPPLRHDRPAPHDRRDLPPLGVAPGDERRSSSTPGCSTP